MGQRVMTCFHEIGLKDDILEPGPLSFIYMKLIIFFTLLLGLAMNSLAAKEIVCVPGKSLADVLIGDTRAVLAKKKFIIDESRTSSDTYLKRSEFLVRLVQDHVVQIWFDGDLSQIKFGTKSLPTKKDLVNLSKFFKNCSPIVKGSGGDLLYCENYGIEFSTSHMDKDKIALSVILPSEAKKVIK